MGLLDRFHNELLGVVGKLRTRNAFYKGRERLGVFEGDTCFVAGLGLCCVRFLVCWPR